MMIQNHMLLAGCVLLGIILSNVEAVCMIKPDLNGNVVIPEGSYNIPHSAFYGCWNLKSIFIPSSVGVIEEYAFDDAHQLTTVVFGGMNLKEKDIENGEEASTLESIGAGAFSHCASLEIITIPASVKVLHHMAFSNSKKLSKVFFENGSILETIYGHVFQDTALQSLIIPASVTKVATGVISGVQTITSFTFECGSKAKVHDDALENSSLKHVTLPYTSSFAFLGVGGAKGPEYNGPVKKLEMRCDGKNKSKSKGREDKDM